MGFSELGSVTLVMWTKCYVARKNATLGKQVVISLSRKEETTFPEMPGSHTGIRTCDKLAMH